MDYQKELKQLKENDEKYEDRKEWLSLDAGLHLVHFESDGAEFESEYQGKTATKLLFDVKYKGKEYSLSVRKGITTTGFYGQLVKFAADNGNTLIGKDVNVVVTGKEVNKRYAVVPASAVGGNS